MDTIHQRFPQYDEGGQALIDKAYAIASAALADETRGNGHPFIEHPVNVALIAADEIGLPADCVAAVFLHEATRKHPEAPDFDSLKIPFFLRSDNQYIVKSADFSG